ncbi:translational GTPase TypA [Pelagicoccus mobilis]|uniref:Large ribosomal subunit assembly factor BipA n=1 Tax=Pelagicoccus mobilis TaxID=415221 RepID=A0A934RXD9_9BACT|nr:translational GTPase TypA [Pelagicoccus mobilis]MBK1876556.1 translational GTPase TypA [Pelagicoccus mobilis]
MKRNEDIRNIAIIAHVDHGKTTLVDRLMQEGGIYRENQEVAERAMDSMDLEREKGITIKAKNTSVHWNGKTINIVDTPGHADFGGEVERVMKMVDGVLLLVDAKDGPQAQTRFVLRKALGHGLKPIVVINKLDREHADPHRVHDLVLELFLALDADDDQFNAPFIYGSAKNGFAVRDLEDERVDMTPLFETVLEHIPAPEADTEGEFKMLVSNIDWDDYVGRVAIGKVLSGKVAKGDTIFRVREDGKRERIKVTKVFEYSGMASAESVEGEAGTIVGVAGFDEVEIGETLCHTEEQEPLPFVEIDPPTIMMQFAVNDGPLAGRDGKLVTSRQIRERLMREMKTNVSIQVEDGETSGVFNVSARGAMQIAVLVETMRREGFEVLVSRPSVITQQIDGVTCEPFETLWIELPEECMGGIMENLNNRRGIMTNMETRNGIVFLEMEIPTRGIIGFEIDLVNATSGHGIMSHLFLEYRPMAGDIVTRKSGTLVSMDNGKTTAYSLAALEDRGKLFVGAGTEVYEGMIVGENPRQGEIPVNPTKAKQLTNFRSSGEGKGIQLSPPITFSLERSIEYIANDEFVEATPNHLRLRKRILNATLRKRASR